MEDSESSETDSESLMEIWVQEMQVAMLDTKEKVYKFKVCLKRKKSVYRQMALKGKSSLYEFAKCITKAYNFAFDHPFGFYSNLKSMYDSKEQYTCFSVPSFDIEKVKEKSVKHSYIHEVFEPGKRMHFHFDYGEDWEFIVECLDVVLPRRGEIGATFPKVTKTVGEAPRQYPEPEPDYDDDDDFEIEDEGL